MERTVLGRAATWDSEMEKKQYGGRRPIFENKITKASLIVSVKLPKYPQPAHMYSTSLIDNLRIKIP